jgi:hypothetical protein
LAVATVLPSSAMASRAASQLACGGVGSTVAEGIEDGAEGAGGGASATGGLASMAAGAPVLGGEGWHATRMAASERHRGISSTNARRR